MAHRSAVKFSAWTAMFGAAIGLAIGSTANAAPYASSLSPARQAAARRYAGATGPATAARTGPAPQKSWNYIGKSQITVATRPSMQIPVATRPQATIPFQKTPSLSVATPPMLTSQNYEPTSIIGFYPALKSAQIAAKRQATRGDDRKPVYKRVILHPERGWQTSTTGAAAAFRRNYNPRSTQ
jgi:hypothetical protein